MYKVSLAIPIYNVSLFVEKSVTIRIKPNI